MERPAVPSAALRAGAERRYSWPRGSAALPTTTERAAPKGIRGKLQADGAEAEAAAESRTASGSRPVAGRGPTNDAEGMVLEHGS